MKVLIILPPFLPAEDIIATLKQILPDSEVLTDVNFGTRDSEVLVATTFTPVGKELIDRLPKLKFVQIASTGYDNVDVNLLKDRGIKLSNIPVANKESVAEHVIAMALVQLKNLFYFHNEIVSGKWPFLTNSTELMGKTFGIIGMGAIGKRLAERLLYFGTNTLYYDPVRLDTDDEEVLGVTYSELDGLLSVSDIISLHVPLTTQTDRFMGADKFSMMKNGAIFINTARGELVEDNALVNAVKSKGLRACIDVYSNEPPDHNSELFKLDNVLFSPHIAGVTVESQQRFITETVSNVLKYVQGLEPLYRVL